jgi:hypothetical protein
MKPLYACFLVGYAAALACAQALLKVAVLSVKTSGQISSVYGFVFELLHRWCFWGAILLCGILVFIWAWFLTFIPLHYAYPFVVLAIIFVGFLEYFFWGAALGYKFFIGTLFIGVGLYCLATQSVK